MRSCFPPAKAQLYSTLWQFCAVWYLVKLQYARGNYGGREGRLFISCWLLSHGSILEDSCQFTLLAHVSHSQLFFISSSLFLSTPSQSLLFSPSLFNGFNNWKAPEYNRSQKAWKWKVSLVDVALTPHTW